MHFYFFVFASQKLPLSQFFCCSGPFFYLFHWFYFHWFILFLFSKPQELCKVQRCWCTFGRCLWFHCSFGWFLLIFFLLMLRFCLTVFKLLSFIFCCILSLWGLSNILTSPPLFKLLFNRNTIIAIKIILCSRGHSSCLSVMFQFNTPRQELLFLSSFFQCCKKTRRKLCKSTTFYVNIFPTNKPLRTVT